MPIVYGSRLEDGFLGDLTFHMRGHRPIRAKRFDEALDLRFSLRGPGNAAFRKAVAVSVISSRRKDVSRTLIVNVHSE